MKTQKIFLSGIISSMILMLVSGVSAMNGSGYGNGKGNTSGLGNGSGKTKYSQSAESSSHAPLDLIKDIPLSNLSEEEAQALIYSYAEESLAHDMYLYFYELYGQQTFLNIALSEAEHQAAVQSLFERYGLETPSDYGELSDEFEVLKAEGEQGLKEALEVGIKIEMLDIEDIAETLLMTDNDDMKIVYTNIGGASYNHLRGFVKALNNKGLSTDLVYQDYVSDAEISSGAFIKDKMAEKVMSSGGELPESVSPQALEEKCEEENQEQWSEEVLAVKEKYNSYVRVKYSDIVQTLSHEQLLTVEANINDRISQEQTDLVLGLLLILQDMVQETLGGTS